MRRYAPWPESSGNIAPAARRRAAVSRRRLFDWSPEGCRTPRPTNTYTKTDHMSNVGSMCA